MKPTRAATLVTLRRAIRRPWVPPHLCRVAQREALQRDLAEIRATLDAMKFNQDWSPADRARWTDLITEEQRLEQALRALT